MSIQGIQSLALGTRTIDADSGVVQAGCTSDTVAWWQAAVAGAKSLLRLPRRPARGQRVATEHRIRR